jgi:hypothetical protein
MITASGDFFKEISRGKSHTAGRVIQEEKMKIISGLLGVLMLTLLALPSHATETQMAVVSKDILSGVRNLDTLDTIIDSAKNPITFYFKDIDKNNDGNLRFGPIRR